ncbi:MAG: endonuclease/exonuclease/phosphatase family protein [Bdellovibrionales bacterium]|nr:endonuclease/exonuclease/phosphatase family protein [Bdellovibrionales bacterium]
MLSPKLCLLLGLVVLSGGCGGGGGGSSDPGDSSDPVFDVSGPDNGGNGESDGEEAAATSFVEFRVTTFNTGLLRYFVPLAEERVAPVAAAVRSEAADVLCLQEVWEERDRREVLDALSDSYPFVYVEPARQRFADRSPVCTPAEVAPLLECFSNACLFTDDGFVECMSGNCYGELEELAERQPQCAQAIFAQTGRSAFDFISVQDELFSEGGRAGLFAFDGSNGLILASKHPFARTMLVDFFDISTTSRRSALLAEVRVDGTGQHVACTHLTSNLDGELPYTGTFGSWKEEARAQGARLREAMASFANGRPEFLAGDFNCSIAQGSTGVASDAEATCSDFLAAGYRDAAMEQLGCSYCASNPLVQGSAASLGGRDLLLDHVFTRGLSAPVQSVERAFGTTIVLQGQQTPLSDHYGIALAAPIPVP